MKYSKVKFEDGKVVETDVRELLEEDLSDECQEVQLEGIGICERCKCKGKECCSGKEIIRTGRNSKGFKVPLGYVVERELKENNFLN